MNNHPKFSEAIEQCLAGQESKNRIFPFLWVHGEPHSRLQEEMDAIYNCGLRAFCVESRPHPHFCEAGWWEDLGFILQYAKQRDMQVWVLDDKHFPTGYANAAIEKKYPHLRRKCVRVACIDVAGPVKDGCCLLPQLDEDEKVLSVCAFRRTGNGEEVDGSSGILLSNVHNGLVFWDVPEGVWRVFYVINTHRGPAHFKNYIDMCDAESCQVMVKEIYDPHYAHFAEYFGNTFRGFFSDEPCFANNIGSFVDTLGTPLLNIPWRDDMPELLAKECRISKEEATLLLPALWYTVEDRTAKIRLAYMNIITKLYRDNFSNMLGKWCEEHGVEYIGHVIEDKGAHMRLGYGSGHYFRALEGQHMSGMDIVLRQIMPGITDMAHTYVSAVGNRAHPDCYHFTIPKLATSAAHLDPKKQGRVMCELYGAFGWAEGVSEMKYLTDCMLSAGVNHFVPHAFSDKVEDPDCPPHFFNGGMNPQYTVFGDLMAYTSRLCHILSSGNSSVSVAVYYNAESEWCGGECASLNEAAGILGRCHTDFDFVPMDVLLNATVMGQQIQAGVCNYRVLIVPYCQIIPDVLAYKLNALAGAGAKIVYLDGKPERTESGNILTMAGTIVQTQELSAIAEQCGWMTAKINEPDLRVLHRSDGEDEMYFFFNANLANKIDTIVKLENVLPYAAYDGWHNELRSIENCNGEYRLILEPGEAILWCTSKQLPQVKVADIKWKKLPVENVKVTLRQQDKVLVQKQYPTLPNQNFAEEFPDFGGVIQYEFVCELPYSVNRLKLDRIGEIARIWINGIDCGSTVNKPHIFFVETAWKKGKNRIMIEVAVNQAYSRRDRFSVNTVLPPMGLFGEIMIQ